MGTRAHKYKQMGGVKENIVTGHKYFSAEKFSDHASHRRAPALRSETLQSSRFLFSLKKRIPFFRNGIAWYVNNNIFRLFGNKTTQKTFLTKALRVSENYINYS